jgi:tRNA 2-thiouridine synthesizing protein B
MKQEQYDVFLLTKPPFNPRSELCLKLAARSGNFRLYLSGDGVYHLLNGIEELPEFRVYACKEDLEARAIKGGDKVTVPDDFYATFIEDIMEHCRHEYTF